MRWAQSGVGGALFGDGPTTRINPMELHRMTHVCTLSGPDSQASERARWLADRHDNLNRFLAMLEPGTPEHTFFDPCAAILRDIERELCGMPAALPAVLAFRLKQAAQLFDDDHRAATPARMLELMVLLGNASADIAVHMA